MYLFCYNIFFLLIVLSTLDAESLLESQGKKKFSIRCEGRKRKEILLSPAIYVSSDESSEEEEQGKIKGTCMIS